MLWPITWPHSASTQEVSTLANTQVDYAYNMNDIWLDGFPPCSLSGFKTCPLPAQSVPVIPTECIPCDITSFYYHKVCTVGTITQVTWQNQKDKSIRLSHRQKDCLANYTSDVYMWACHSVNHSTTASQYKRQQWAQFVEAKKENRNTKLVFQFPHKGCVFITQRNDVTKQAHGHCFATSMMRHNCGSLRPDVQVERVRSSGMIGQLFH